MVGGRGGGGQRGRGSEIGVVGGRGGGGPRGGWGHGCGGGGI